MINYRILRDTSKPKNLHFSREQNVETCVIPHVRRAHKSLVVLTNREQRD